MRLSGSLMPQEWGMGFLTAVLAAGSFDRNLFTDTTNHLDLSIGILLCLLAPILMAYRRIRRLYHTQNQN